MTVEASDAGKGNTDAPADAKAVEGSTLLSAGPEEGSTTLLGKVAEEGKDGEAGTEGKKDSEGDEPAGAPEEYAEFTAPEGVELNQDALNELKTVAKEMDLSQEKAQRFVDLGAKMLADNAAKAAEDQRAQWDSTREGWVKELKSDGEFGGDKFEANVKLAQQAVRNFGSESLVKYLEETGLGDNPEIVKMFARMGKLTGEDRSGEGVPKGASSIEDSFFPTMK